MKTSTSRLSRRNFLLAVGAGGVATAATVVQKAPQSKSSKSGAAADSKGYRLSEHVQKYYRTTQV